MVESTIDKIAISRLSKLEEEYFKNPSNITIWEELKSLRTYIQGCVDSDKK